MPWWQNVCSVFQTTPPTHLLLNHTAIGRLGHVILVPRLPMVVPRLPTFLLTTWPFIILLTQLLPVYQLNHLATRPFADRSQQWDLQAMARVHRIGQTKPVHVYRLCTEGTVEDRIQKRAEQKLYLDQVGAAPPKTLCIAGAVCIAGEC